MSASAQDDTAIRIGTLTLAIDVGATHTRIASVADGAVAWRVLTETAALSRDSAGVAAGLPPAIARFLQDGGPGRTPGIIATGISIAATVDGMGSVIASPDVVVPLGTALRDGVAALLDVPVVVDNDANLAALAEQRYGAARGRRNAAVLALGTNIGLGLILDGRLYRGAHGAAGEIGLLVVPAVTTDWENGQGRTVDAGPLGHGSSRAPEGYAWIEELAGGGALAAAAGRQKAFDPSLADPIARAAVDRAVEGWAIVIADLAVVIDPEVVVLVGALAVDAADVVPRLQRRVAELVARPPEIRLGTVGPDAQLLGADLLAREATAERAPIHARAGLSAQSIGGKP